LKDLTVEAVAVCVRVADF